MALVAIDPAGGHQRSRVEIPATFYTRPRRQLVNDKVDDVFGDVHRGGCGSCQGRGGEACLDVPPTPVSERGIDDRPLRCA